MGTKTKSPPSQFTIPVIGIKINHKAMRDQRIKRFIFFKFPSIAVTENPMLQSLKFSYPRFLFPTGEYFQGCLFVCLCLTVVSKVTSNRIGPPYSLWLDFPLIFTIIKGKTRKRVKSLKAVMDFSRGFARDLASHYGPNTTYLLEKASKHQCSLDKAASVHYTCFLINK